MENLNREAILRMLSGKAGNSSSGGGGGDIDLAGYATSIWVTQNFVSIDFFRELFKAYDANGNEVLPNDTETTINNIKAMFGFWTDQYLSALGQGSGGGGGGGASALSDLLDVELTTLQNGQALIYSSALGKWTNGTAGVNMTQVWSALDSATNEQINVSHLTNALSGYVTTSAISDMATQTWVGQQGYATQTWVGQNFITIAFFDRLFQAYEGTGSSATRVNPNDTTSTIDNIKAMFGFWTEFYLSALGDGSASSGSISLGMLSDVSLSSPTDGQALIYDAANSQWVNGTVTSGVSSLSALSDVQLTAPATNQVLMYDSSTTKWYNSDLKTINGQPIYGSGNISISGGGGCTTYLDAYVSGRPSTINWLYGDDRLRYFIVSGNATGIPPMGNSMGLHFSWDNTGGYEAQMAIGHNDHRRIQFRCMDTGTWKEWATVQDSSHPISITLESDNQVLMDLCNYYANPYGLIVSSAGSGALMMQSRRRGSAQYFALCLNHEGGNVGIGTNTPNKKLQVFGVGKFGSGEKGILIGGSYNDDSNYGSIDRVVNGNSLHLQYTNSGNVALCEGGGRVSIGTDSPDTRLHVVGGGGKFTTSDGTDGIIVAGSSLNGEENYGSIDRILQGSNLFLQYTNTGHLVTCMGGGNVGIGVTPSYRLHVSGSIYATGGVTALSDARMKDVKGNLALMVDEIANAPAVEFTWKGERVKEGLQAGTLAQYWQKVLPMVVMDKGGELSMQYGVAALVSSIITARKVVDHERRIADLERENKELKLKLKIA